MLIRYTAGHLGQVIHEHEEWPYAYTIHTKWHRVSLLMLRPNDGSMFIGMSKEGKRIIITLYQYLLYWWMIRVRAQSLKNSNSLVSSGNVWKVNQSFNNTWYILILPFLLYTKFCCSLLVLVHILDINTH